MPLVQRLFFIWKYFSLFFFFFSFFWKDLEVLKFFCIFFLLFYYIYTHKQSSLNTTWKFWIQRNIKTWNKQTNFILNHDIANQMQTETKLGHLLLLDPLGCLRLGGLEPWLWWNGLGLHFEGMHLVNFWPLMLIMRIHLWWA